MRCIVWRGSGISEARTYSAFLYHCKKQHGALLAKGRILGIQFDVLFEK